MKEHDLVVDEREGVLLADEVGDDILHLVVEPADVVFSEVEVALVRLHGVLDDLHDDFLVHALDLVVVEDVGELVGRVVGDVLGDRFLKAELLDQEVGEILRHGSLEVAAVDLVQRLPRPLRHVLPFDEVPGLSERLDGVLPAGRAHLPVAGVLRVDVGCHLGWVGAHGDARSHDLLEIGLLIGEVGVLGKGLAVLVLRVVGVGGVQIEDWLVAQGVDLLGELGVELGDEGGDLRDLLLVVDDARGTQQHGDDDDEEDERHERDEASDGAHCRERGGGVEDRFHAVDDEFDGSAGLLHEEYGGVGYLSRGTHGFLRLIYGGYGYGQLLVALGDQLLGARLRHTPHEQRALEAGVLADAHDAERLLVAVPVLAGRLSLHLLLLKVALAFGEGLFPVLALAVFCAFGVEAAVCVGVSFAQVGRAFLLADDEAFRGTALLGDCCGLLRAEEALEVALPCPARGGDLPDCDGLVRDLDMSSGVCGAYEHSLDALVMLRSRASSAETRYWRSLSVGGFG